MMRKIFPCKRMCREHVWRRRTRRFSSSHQLYDQPSLLVYPFTWEAPVGFRVVLWEGLSLPFSEADNPVRAICPLGLLFMCFTVENIPIKK